MASITTIGPCSHGVINAVCSLCSIQKRIDGLVDGSLHGHLFGSDDDTEARVQELRWCFQLIKLAGWHP